MLIRKTALIDTETGDVYADVDDLSPRDSRIASATRSQGRPGFRRLQHLGNRHPGLQRPVYQNRGDREPTIVRTSPTEGRVNARADGEYFSVKKEVVAELIPTLGELASASLGRPDMPRYTGDPSTDYANAALHREALALHDQTRERIRVTSNLIERFAKVVMS